MLTATILSRVRTVQTVLLKKDEYVSDPGVVFYDTSRNVIRKGENFLPFKTRNGITNSTRDAFGSTFEVNVFQATRTHTTHLSRRKKVGVFLGI